jgi:hypothetical protein
VNGVEKDWLQDILDREGQSHLNFFGQEFDLSEFENTLKKYGQEKIEDWRRLGLEPHFLPEVVMAHNDSYLTWKVKLEKWYYLKTDQGKILRSINGNLVAEKEPFKLEGIIVLIDTRLKPAYEGGKQMYEDDNLLGPVIEELRKEGKIAKYEYGPQSSRFGLSSNEWEGYVKPVLAEKLSLKPNQIRLERTIEANVIPQLYPYMCRKDDGGTNTWIWYEEFFGSDDCRLHGGLSGRFGLAFECCRWPGDQPDRHWQCRALRPLAVL